MDISPSVINHSMLEKAFREQSRQGEILRLSEDIDWSSVTSIRLEFQGILKINHLWPLKNLTKLSLNYNKIDTIENLEELIHLKELDLSFNYIERIQKLDCLEKLEVLSVFSNRIQVIENLEVLKKLVILNLGANKINSLNGFERLRFLPDLKVFNLERNPLQDTMDVRQLVCAYLPNLKYYNYTHISQKEKDAAAMEYSRELRELKERERLEITRLTNELELAAERDHHYKCFVEDLSGHQLFEKLFDGVTIENIEFLDAKIELKTHMFVLTQKIFVAGLDRYTEREEEVKQFRICLDNAKRRNQKDGQKIITFLQHYFSKTPKLVDESWKRLMAMEVQLYESIEDISKSFGHVIGDLINAFLKDTQSTFRQVKELIDSFSENVSLILDHKYKGSLETLWKDQRNRLDEREFQLQERAREWADNLLDSFKEQEIERNRKKIIEINFFFDSLKNHDPNPR